METKHKALEEQFEMMKKGISETASLNTDTETIDSLRKRMMLKFKFISFVYLQCKQKILMI